ncbi:MAG TPA: 4-hydroxy-tetrahydrodipicolinate reductase [Treponema sp.]|jgi:4-hydroxy-tetrahydrodipicolinate reductase|nr:4-hydroxy-tetrahydrodipicolinate reductase [Treponema sp.]HBB42801.1 4-hydroxy-tetrahydrodipicolinate reductase [Treponema sp.]
MKIALVGYGKMGHMLEQTALGLGHEVVATVDSFAKDASFKVPQDDGNAVADAVEKSGAEGIIEFTSPASVIGNIKALLPLKLPLVVGTTGWNDKMGEIESLASKTGGTVMHSANFSIGVNMFYRIVEEAAKLVDNFSEYDAAVWEMHHNQKADSPSGTAIDIAKRVLSGLKRKTELVTDAFHGKPEPRQLHVSSTRCGTVPGTHKVFFDSAADTIELTHTARSRQGFASGAVHALENLKSFLDSGKLQPGRLYGMSDVFPGMF